MDTFLLFLLSSIKRVEIIGKSTWFHTVNTSVVLVSYIVSGNVLNEILCFHFICRYNFSDLFIFIL